MALPMAGCMRPSLFSWPAAVSVSEAQGEVSSPTRKKNGVVLTHLRHRLHALHALWHPLHPWLGHHGHGGEGRTREAHWHWHWPRRHARPRGARVASKSGPHWGASPWVVWIHGLGDALQRAERGRRERGGGFLSRKLPLRYHQPHFTSGRDSGVRAAQTVTQSTHFQ